MKKAAILSLFAVVGYAQDQIVSTDDSKSTSTNLTPTTDITTGDATATSDAGSTTTDVTRTLPSSFAVSGKLVQFVGKDSTSWNGKNIAVTQYVDGVNNRVLTRLTFDAKISATLTGTREFTTFTDYNDSTNSLAYTLLSGKFCCFA